jgi:hypothetical protein
MVLGFFPFAASREEHLHNLRVRFPLLGRGGLGIQVNGDFCVGVPQKLLSDLNIDPKEPQVRTQL